MEKKNNSWAQLWRTEDWLAVWIGFIIIALGCMSVLTGAFDFSAFNFKTWGWGEAAATNVTPLGVQMSSPSFLVPRLRSMFLYEVGTSLV